LSEIEWVAAGLGLANIVLVARRSLWNYPFALIMVTLYFFVFFEAKLYSDALLQIFFFVINLYGWRNWLGNRRIDAGVAVGALSGRARIGWAAGTVAACLLWGAGMARYTDAAAPVIDAMVAGMSVAAQILQSRRRLESWWLWLAVDALATGLYWSRGLVATAVLYAIFFGVALWGLIAWGDAMRRATP